MPDQFSPESVAGLDGERVQRPEVRLGEPKQWTPTESRDDHGGKHDERRANPCRFRETAGGLADPGRQDQRREPQENRRQQDLDEPAEGELGQADLAEKAARNRQQRALLGRRMIVLEVAEAGIEIDAPAGCGLCAARRSAIVSVMAASFRLGHSRGVDRRQPNSARAGVRAMRAHGHPDEISARALPRA